MSYMFVQTNDRVERRHDNRFPRPLRMVIDGQIVESNDWGFGGFRSLRVPGLGPEREFLISHIFNADGAPIAVFATAKVVRSDPETGDIGAAFVHLGERAFAMLEQTMMPRRRVRGVN